MSRTIYTPCHITIFNLFLLSYYISFKRLLIFQQLLHCPNQYWKNIQYWVYTICQACSLAYSPFTPRWVSFLCTRLASGSNRTCMSEIWRNRAGKQQLWLLLVIISSNDLMPMALLTYIVVCIVRCIMLFWMSKGAEFVPQKKTNCSLSHHESTLNHGLEVADQRDHFGFYLLDFCMPTLRMAHCIFNLKFLLVSRIWRK